MICPNCGWEHMGKKCPYCDGYYMRIDTKKEREHKDHYELCFTEHSDRKRHEEDEDEIKREKYGKGMSYGKSVSTKFHKVKKDFLKKAVLCFDISAAAVISVVIIVDRVHEMNDHDLYIYRDAGIYKYDKGDFKEEQSTGDTVFNINKNLFTETDGTYVSDGEVMQKVSSDNGNYIAVVSSTGDEINGSVYKVTALYGENKTESKTLTESDKMIEIRDVTDSGDVIFTETDVQDEGLKTGDTSLYLYDKYEDDSDGNVSMIEPSVSKTYVYGEQNKIIVLNNSKELYTYDYSSSDKTLIAKDVASVNVESNEEDGELIYSQYLVNNNKYADKFIYKDGSGVHLYDTSSNTDTFVAQLEDSVKSYIYDSKNHAIYAVANSGLKRAYYDAALKSFEDIDSLDSSGDYLWDDKKDTLIYVNDNNELKAIKGSETKILASGVDNGTLLNVQNDSGFVYKIGSGLYYSGNSNKSGEKVADVSEYLTKICKKDGNLIYIDKKKIYSIDVMDKTSETKGTADDFWIAW